MTKRVLILSAIVITSVAAGCSSKSEAATNQKSSRVVVAAGAKAETDDYSVELKPAGSYSKDKDGQFEVVIIAKGDKHINEQYPFKFTPKESEDIAYKGAVGREGGTFETTRAVLRVPFVPKKAGGVSVAGKVSLSVCSDKNCLMEKQELELSIAVKLRPRGDERAADTKSGSSCEARG